MWTHGPGRITCDINWGPTVHKDQIIHGDDKLGLEKLGPCGPYESCCSELASYGLCIRIFQSGFMPKLVNYWFGRKIKIQHKLFVSYSGNPKWFLYTRQFMIDHHFCTIYSSWKLYCIFKRAVHPGPRMNQRVRKFNLIDHLHLHPYQ